MKKIIDNIFGKEKILLTLSNIFLIVLFTFSYTDVVDKDLINVLIWFTSGCMFGNMYTLYVTSEENSNTKKEIQYGAILISILLIFLILILMYLSI
ncbi:hypothetical protein [Flammeovirga kamogawensis]|uniref:Uncharacterized protein n=1 Tax=Flammeovirga kamogawensis TaxID=373891 RepID=A0ABX8H4I4_9BACT|nr:hypothetical protein [Flammeovirga kamogawensis]MBB6461872.1 hypothetical protein [Flammeovirga kamogawensis]QWG10514.1 hypothetical protein KM029_26435 [Flammeovirga kamogawensis]TRX63623.1 hypothetical protein EO216_24710 [Flammeovirga kamogawensis]